MATFDNPRDTWNERFADPDYLFGEEPNAFVRATALRYVKSGQTVLCVADGEGRNSVWLAEQGLRVTAFDFAANAVDKARALAKRRGVNADHRLADLNSWHFEPASVDALVAIFIQFLGPEEREGAFARMKSAVKPGGHVLLEGYRPEQLTYGTGGPGAVENLYTPEWIEQTFHDWEILELRAYDAMLTEGKRHVGMSAMIDVVARRPG
jgi:cyclopropane fatty-acyl-phospholipid synthase-like methyltransferase